MPKALKVCSRPGCPNLVASGRCEDCTRVAEAARGTAAERGYDSRWRRRRAAFLRKPTNLFCRLCGAPSSVADHWPLSRKELVAAGVKDPDADELLRPLCTGCHNSETSKHQPGGWNAG